MKVEGYTKPFTKTITIAAETRKPYLGISSTKATVNTAYGSKTAYFYLYGEEFESVPTVTVAPEGAATPLVEYNGEFDQYVISLTSVTGKKATATISVKDEFWAAPITFKVTLNVNNKLPTAKAATGTLLLNTAYPEQDANTRVVLNTNDVYLSGEPVELTPSDKKAAAKTEAAKLEVVYEDYEITARIRTPEDPETPISIKPGTYSFTFTPKLSSDTEGTEGAALKPITVKVKVAGKAAVTATVSAKGKLDAIQREATSIIYTLTKLDSVMGDVSDVAVTGADAGLFDVELLGWNAKSQPMVELTLKPDVAVSTKAKYKIALEFEIDGEIKATTKTLTVKVTQSKVKATLTPKSTTLFQSERTTERPALYYLYLNSPYSAQIERVELSKKTPLAFWKSLGANAEVKWEPDDDWGVNIEITVKDPSKVVNGKSYKVLLDVYPVGCATNAKPTTVTATVVIKK